MGANGFNEMEIDAIGEIMNISLGASATAVSTLLGTKVDITTPTVTVQTRLPVLEGLEDWSNDALFAALSGLAASLEVKNAIVLWPVRVAVSGKLSTPGGATELCALLGKDESIKRIHAGIEKLS